MEKIIHIHIKRIKREEKGKETRELGKRRQLLVLSHSSRRPVSKNKFVSINRDGHNDLAEDGKGRLRRLLVR